MSVKAKQAQAFGDIPSGVGALRDALAEVLRRYRAFGRCEGSMIGGVHGVCQCPWCLARAQVEAWLRHITSGDLSAELENVRRDGGGALSVVFEPPEGPTTVHCIAVLADALDPPSND
ncbi:hypothetical protein [Yinghuangia soli]|uniref:Uncharacterized protein n=1 Tax=Yinghuangia soli TaxID=2908204 RepID=A0AA41Q435_9ACTN|nr:hypothetical protein [Yinghuangia soli]MCF2531173.1 hypothetical protein [Yinghuangia soli]